MSDDSLTPDDVFDELEPEATDHPVLDEVLATQEPKERSGLSVLAPTPEEVASFKEFAGRIGDATTAALTIPPAFRASVKNLAAKVVPPRVEPVAPATTLPKTHGGPGDFTVHLPADVLSVVAAAAAARRVSMERYIQGLVEDEAYRLATE